MDLLILNVLDMSINKNLLRAAKRHFFVLVQIISLISHFSRTELCNIFAESYFPCNQVPRKVQSFIEPKIIISMSS